MRLRAAGFTYRKCAIGVLSIYSLVDALYAVLADLRRMECIGTDRIFRTDRDPKPLTRSRTVISADFSVFFIFLVFFLGGGVGQV